MTEWCWYVEEGSFRPGFTSRKDAIRDARESEEDPSIVYVGTVSDAVDEMCLIISAKDIADSLEEHLNVEGCRVHVGAGAQEALEAWVREFICFDSPCVCTDGERPTKAEWEDSDAD